MTTVSQHLLPTASGFQLEIGPFLVQIRSNLPGVAQHLERVYADFAVHPERGGHFDIAITRGPGVRRWVRRQAHLTINGKVPFLPLPEVLAGPLLDWGLNWCIGQTAHRWVAVHAAVVERNGSALVMPAAPGSGKSTLCSALAFSGWRFFSDEFALLDPESRHVHPLPRPISLKNRSIVVVQQRFPEVVTTTPRTDIEGARFVYVRPPGASVQRARDAAPVRWMIFPKYEAGSPTILEPFPKAQSLIVLTDQCFNYNYLGTRGFNCLVDLVRHADCYSLTYSDLDDALPRLAELADG